MFSANLADYDVWQHVILHQVFRESLTWLEKHAATAELGDYPLEKPNWYANVHTYTTLPETECRWENHLHTIDIQYLVSGSEGIRWAHVRQLGAPQRYLEEKDRQEFAAPGREHSLVYMTPGMFSIFTPGDAHCPKIALDGSVDLRKVVVKIPVQLILAPPEGTTSL